MMNLFHGLLGLGALMLIAVDSTRRLAGPRGCAAVDVGVLV